MEFNLFAGSVGGLGIGSLRDRNIALLLKWFGRFAQEEKSLWRRRIASIYGVDPNGWFPKKGAGFSERATLGGDRKLKNIFLGFIMFKALDGKDVRF